MLGDGIWKANTSSAMPLKTKEFDYIKFGVEMSDLMRHVLTQNVCPRRPLPHSAMRFGLRWAR